MIYSLAPLTNDANSHVGFGIVFVITVVVMLFAIWDAKESYWSTGNSIFSIIFLALAFFAHSVSYAPENNIPMKNEKITAKFIDYVAEEQKHSCGKSTCYTNLVYGRFETPEGSVLLKVDRQSPIPENVLLYKN